MSTSVRLSQRVMAGMPCFKIAVIRLRQFFKKQNLYIRCSIENGPLSEAEIKQLYLLKNRTLSKLKWNGENGDNKKNNSLTAELQLSSTSGLPALTESGRHLSNASSTNFRRTLSHFKIQHGSMKLYSNSLSFGGACSIALRMVHNLGTSWNI